MQENSGRYAVSGAIDGAIVELDIRTLYVKDLSFFGCSALKSDIFQNLIDCIEKGMIKPVVAHNFPLEESSREMLGMLKFFIQRGYLS